MAGANFNYERAAQVLAEAALYGDVKALQNAGLTRQTLHNYRKRLQSDETLLQLFTHKKALLEREWAADLAPAIRGAIDFLARASQQADASDPDAIHAVAGALKILSGVALTKQVLDARLTERGGQVRATDSPHAAANTSHLTN